mmetsp:Transcript_1956/g.4289  ORF Transcript_1956/g.4289 Transcript_1956/m.4289 type:complete len:288 (+) Transcript_1956:421-1284(+)
MGRPGQILDVDGVLIELEKKRFLLIGTSRETNTGHSIVCLIHISSDKSQFSEVHVRTGGSVVSPDLGRGNGVRQELERAADTSTAIQNKCDTTVSNALIKEKIALPEVNQACALPKCSRSGTVRQGLAPLMASDPCSWESGAGTQLNVAFALLFQMSVLVHQYGDDIKSTSVEHYRQLGVDALIFFIVLVQRANQCRGLDHLVIVRHKVVHCRPAGIRLGNLKIEHGHPGATYGDCDQFAVRHPLALDEIFSVALARLQVQVQVDHALERIHALGRDGNARLRQSPD